MKPKKTILSLVLFFSSLLFAGQAIAISEADLLGAWSYDGFIFEGNRFPRPNPNLFLSFTFKEGNIVQLYWKRTDENFFCDRIAQFKIIDGNKLYQKIIWTNPENHFSCSSDADMQIGRETTTEMIMKENELHLVLNLDGKPFYYVLKSAGPESPVAPIGQNVEQ